MVFYFVFFGHNSLLFYLYLLFMFSLYLFFHLIVQFFDLVLFFHSLNLQSHHRVIGICCFVMSAKLWLIFRFIRILLLNYFSRAIIVTLYDGSISLLTILFTLFEVSRDDSILLTCSRIQCLYGIEGQEAEHELILLFSLEVALLEILKLLLQHLMILLLIIDFILSYGIMIIE